IKVLYLRPARAPGQSRNMSQVWFRHHRRHRGGNVFVDKFCPDMGVENFAEVLHRGIFRHGNASPWSNCDKRPTDGRTHNRFDELATSHRAPKGLDKASYRLELGNSERQLSTREQCPLCPQKRTCALQLGMSAKGHKRTHALHQTTSLFDQL